MSITSQTDGFRMLIIHEKIISGNINLYIINIKKTNI